MELTTQDIIKILPFDEGFKAGLLERFDSLDADQKYQMEKILWNLYDAIYTMKIQQKVNDSLDPQSDKEVKLDRDFYKRIEEEVDQEMTTESTQAVEAVDLQSTRDKLQEIINTPQE